MKRPFFCFLFLLGANALFAQSNTGELHLKVTDPSGLGVQTAVDLSSEANQFQQTFLTDDSGDVVAQRLPFGIYLVQIHQPGFAPFSESLEIRSAVPIRHTIQLKISAVSTSVIVTGSDTLIDPHSVEPADRIGTQMIEDRSTSLPGRSLQDLVNSQPGWLYEGNAVLHPRGSEYQTQFVINGIPLMDNRSPSFGPEIEADDVQDMTIYTAGIPAEYGRKMGGVVEVDTEKNVIAGLHGQMVLSGGSFDTAGAYARAEYGWGKNSLGVNADGDHTGWYLNPPVPQNFTNTGTTGDFGASYERDFSDNDRLNLSVRHELSRFDVPNELLQETAGQRQNRDNYETMGIVSYQHVFSPDLVADLRGMVRDDSDGFWSNPQSTPIIAFQNRGFREGYFKGSVAYHHGIHEWKAGVESDNIFIHEQFNYTITDPTQFDPGTPLQFCFPCTGFGVPLTAGDRPDLEQSAFVQDLMRLGKWTVSAGLRWDHYQLLVNQNAVSPRLGLARYFPSHELVLHASYDRVFQTPAFENILLASSPSVVSLDTNVLRGPIRPSLGNYYEFGFEKGFFGQMRLDANYFRRDVNNYADDDPLLNTSVSYPVAFLKAEIYGAEGKLTVPHWGRASGFVSYSYIVGAAFFPVTGGLFLGEEAVNSPLTGHFPDTQDQRNTVRVHGRYALKKRFWVAGGAEYGSGLPVAFEGTEADAAMQYGQDVLDRVNFARGRVKPSLAIDASAGADLLRTDRWIVRLQADGQNLNNRLNLIDFAGLFSGNAVGPSRSYSLRLSADF